MTGLNSLGWKIHDHLKQHRPTMFQELKADGRLNRYVLEQQSQAGERLTTLEHQGLYPHEAMELLREQIFLPSEADVSTLGETTQPYTE